MLFSAGTKVLLAAGVSFEAGKHSEIIDLENPSFHCSKVNEYPTQATNMPTGGYIGDKALICGGATKHYNIKDCYTLNEDRKWKKEPWTLDTRRNNAAVGPVVIQEKLIIAGGWGGYSHLDTIELVSPITGPSKLSVKLPKATSGFCIVQWNANSFMAIGGCSDGNCDKQETYIIDIVRNTLKEGPKLNVGRKFHLCNVVFISGKPYVIVAGGQNSQNVNLKSTEALSMTSYEEGWIPLGNKDIKFAILVQKTRHFIIDFISGNANLEVFGGRLMPAFNNGALFAIGNYNTPNVYKFSCEGDIGNCKWDLTGIKLVDYRSSLVAMVIPNDMANKLC